MKQGLAVLAAIAALAVSGCGSDDEAGAPQAPAAGAEDVTATASPEPASTVPATTATSEGEAPAGKATPGGTTLKIGEPATILYDDSGNTGKKTLIEVTPKSIEKGSLDDFKNIDLDAEQKSSTPYYVELGVKNVGKNDLSGSEPGSYIDAVDDRGQEQNEVIFFGDFDRCPEADPKSFKPGDTYETCLTFLIPGGGSVEGMRWIFFDEKNSKSNIDWKQ